jgi:hypothetical protein
MQVNLKIWTYSLTREHLLGIRPVCMEWSHQWEHFPNFVVPRCKDVASIYLRIKKSKCTGGDLFCLIDWIYMMDTLHNHCIHNSWINSSECSSYKQELREDHSICYGWFSMLKQNSRLFVKKVGSNMCVMACVNTKEWKALRSVITKENRILILKYFANSPPGVFFVASDLEICVIRRKLRISKFSPFRSTLINYPL